MDDIRLIIWLINHRAELDILVPGVEFTVDDDLELTDQVRKVLSKAPNNSVGSISVE